MIQGAHPITRTSWGRYFSPVADVLTVVTGLSVGGAAFGSGSVGLSPNPRCPPWRQEGAWLQVLVPLGLMPTTMLVEG